MSSSTEKISTVVSLLENHHQNMTFSWYDYTLFALLLGLSTAIGVYFGCSGSKQSSAREYLLGGKKMSSIPIALSLVASHVSGITLLAAPTDIYLYGTAYCWSLLSVVMVCVINNYVYLPVFCRLQITSVYEYVKLRFDNKLRIVASLMNCISSCMYLPIVVYIPALAFAQGTNISVHLITPIVCSICIFYTTIGGLKAVVWTDALQFVAMIGGILAVFFVGVKRVGGFGAVYDATYESDRFTIDWDISPFKRDSIYSVLIGLTFNWINIVCVNQGVLQKFMALPNTREVKKALVMFGVGEVVIKGTTMFTGLIMLAFYYKCDPITSKQVTRHDQMLPYFIMDVAGDIPGLSGLFIAGIFSASLSTLSALMNALAGTIYEDFLSVHMPANVRQKTVSNILKCIVVLIGVVVIGLVFVVEQLGGLLPLAISLSGALSGPLLGLFSLGILVPKANSKGALYGTICSLLIMSWMMVGSQWYQSQGVLKYPLKPLRTDGCDFNNSTSTTHHTLLTAAEQGEGVFFLYRITHYYYSVIGSLIVMIVGIPVSYLTNKDAEPVNRELLSPAVQWMVPEEKEEMTYYSIDKALHLMTIDNTNEKLKE